MRTLAIAVLLTLTSAAAHAIDEEHLRKGEAMIASAVEFLRSQQDAETGGWAVNPSGPQFPAITGLVLNGLLMQPDIDADDPQVVRGIDFILQYRQDDGGIYDRVLASYNTAISLSALARAEREDAAAAIPPAQRFLGRLQWSDSALDHPETGNVDEDHPFYGGVGYGRNGRPDLSNTSLMLQGLKDSGLDADDEAFYRAVRFLERIQMHEDINDQSYAEGSTQGGFIYAPGPNGEEAGVGESKAGFIEESVDDGTRVSRLRAYGSMTYAGFKSYIYANLDRDDRRVQLAYTWLRKHYTLEENPGLGMEGLYYYFVTLSRALDAWGLPTVQTLNADGTDGPTRDWANDLIDRLAELQQSDGSFQSVNDRWMEDNPVLITAYALLALQHAVR